ncbi:MAG: hypothetical protein ACJASK_001379, partial [Ilumatobacter sp.]
MLPLTKYRPFLHKILSQGDGKIGKVKTSSPALYAAGRKLSMFSVPRLHPHLPRRRVAGSMIALGVLAMGL